MSFSDCDFPVYMKATIDLASREAPAGPSNLFNEMAL